MPNDVTARTSLAFSLTATLEQTMRTGSMKVNPYLAFDPHPGRRHAHPGGGSLD